MADTPTLSDIEEWDGALGPQSDTEPLYYELRVKDQSVRLLGPSPGQLYDYDLDEFKSLVAQDEWILADNDTKNEVFHTPDGDHPY